MTLHEYEHKGRTYKFDEHDAPAGAVKIEREKAVPAPPANKARKPANKARLSKSD